MNFKKKKHIESVFRYDASNNGIIAQINEDEHNIIRYDDKFNVIWKKNIETYAYEICLLKSYIIFRLSNGSLKILTYNTGNEITRRNSIGLQFRPIEVFTTHLLRFNIKKSIIDFDWKFGIYDLIDDKVLWEKHNSEYKGGELVNDSLASEDNGFIILTNALNGQKIWQTQLNRNGKILNFLGVHEKVLVACLQFGNAFGLMGLNIHTGEILWNRDNWGLLQGHHTTMTNGKIFSLKGGFSSDSYYLEADITTVSLIRYGEVPNLKKHGFSVFNYTLHENFIYFTANKLGTTEASIIGVLAYDNLELLWWQEVELQNGAFFGLSNKPVIDGDRLYILDTGGTLHIFERES